MAWRRGINRKLKAALGVIIKASNNIAASGVNKKRQQIVVVMWHGAWRREK